MGVKPSLPLSTKIALLLLLNLALVLVVFVGFAKFQLRDDFQSFFMTTARERIHAVSRQLALEIQETPPAKLDALLARYSETHGVTFFLLRYDGSPLAGPSVPVPDEVQQRIHRPRPPAPPEGEEPEGPGIGNRRNEGDALKRHIFESGRFGGGRPEGGRPDGPRFENMEAFFRSGPIGYGPMPPFLVETTTPLRYWVGLRIPVRTKDSSRIMPGTLLLASPTLLSNPFFFQITPWLTVVGVALAVSLLCWLPFVRSLSRSVEKMMSATADIAEGRFDVQVETHRRDELGHLSRSIHRMASRLENYVRGQKRFLGDVAHELRSPLARMQLASDILDGRLQGNDRNYVGDIKEDVGLMIEITDELLAYAKAEMGRETVRLSPTSVAEVVQRALRAERAAESAVVAVDDKLMVLVEPDFLFRSISNLLRNAMRYAGGDGPVTIGAERSGSMVRITVSDCGPGVPEAALEKIFTPFYRVEESRDRKSGGTGLGLAIVRSCVEACRGSIECRNRKPSGLEVSILLPAA